MESVKLKVDQENSGLRLDVFLTKNLTEVPSRSFVKQLIDSGQVVVNQRQVKVHQRVALDDEVYVELNLEEVPPEQIEPENITLDIFYEDADLLLVYKPVGMLVHPVKSCVKGTLVNGLLYYCKTLSDLNTAVRPGIVHRLDRATSGIMVVAKNNVAHVRIARQFEKHKVKKVYFALVEGRIEFDEGVIDAPLARHIRHHDKKVVAFNDSAKQSKTLYRVVRRFPKATLVALYPKTGRTHQLRVHMAYLGYPILGDDKYGKKNSFFRLALHAQSLGFIHPKTKKYVEFSVKLPKEFLDYS